jgi:cytochrome c556
MKIWAGLAAATMAAAITAGVAWAQQNPIEARQKLMKANGREATLVAKMAKGELPYDAKKVSAAFDQWEKTAKEFGKLFPENSKTGGDTRALPKIWTDRAEFDKHLAAFGKDVTAQKAKATSGLDGLKQAMAVVGKDCKGCHDEFRAAEKKK